MRSCSDGREGQKRKTLLRLLVITVYSRSVYQSSIHPRITPALAALARCFLQGVASASTTSFPGQLDPSSPPSPPSRSPSPRSRPSRLGTPRRLQHRSSQLTRRVALLHTSSQVPPEHMYYPTKTPSLGTYLHDYRWNGTRPQALRATQPIPSNAAFPNMTTR